MLRRFVLTLAACAAFAPCQSMAQSMTNLTHQAPDGAIVEFQLTDGTVLVQGFGEQDFWKLTPDNKGSYQNGTWTQVASLPADYSPYAQAEGVFADGRVIISGGEYNFDQFAFTNQSAIYDPLTNKWTELAPPKGWTNIGDSPAMVTADNKFLVGYKFKKKMAYLDPATLTWVKAKSKHKNDEHAEEGWTLLPDGSILTYDVQGHPQSERYFPGTGEWKSEGSTVVDLRGAQNCCGRCIHYGPKNKCYDPPGEVGSAILRPDGTVFATGAIPDGESTAHTAVWTPPAQGENQGHWAAGPDFPNGDQAFDTGGSLLPNGNVLTEGSSGQLYEFDGTILKRENFNGGGNSMMVLPTGEILIGGFAVYKSTGTYNQAWAPTVTSAPSSVNRGSTYQISGTQFNGLSNANAFGDEFDTRTNYPLVRITNNSTGHVFYAKTHDHSTMGVATGNATVSTNFDVPSGTETGASQLVVVANGIPSTAVAITVN